MPVQTRGSGGLPRYLREIQSEIEKYARDYNLDFFPTFFEVVNYDEMNEIASYGGFPTRYPHWRFGMEYDRMKKSSTYGLSKIYELVINNDPCVAYLLEGNSIVDQKIVMAHVFAHCDFFKNNSWFKNTNRRMIDGMANHGSHMRKYMNRFGVSQVENFIDVCLSLDNLIDIYNPPSGADFKVLSDDNNGDLDSKASEQNRIKAKSYMDKYINPPEYLADQKKKLTDEKNKNKKFPVNAKRDILGFLIKHAPLKPWQRGVMEIIRQEAYYFAPQGQTKIMNEGWATFWHSKIMTEKVLNTSEIVDYADHASMVTATSGMRLNPYKMGLELMRDIYVRWEKGRFGKEWDECDSMEEREKWDTKAGLGMEKIFEVRHIYNDVTFIDEFLTYEFVRDQKLFSFGYNKRNSRYEIESRKFNNVKQKMLFQLTNMGQPIISVADANHKNRGELLLKHDHQGMDLDPAYTQEVLGSLHTVWKRPVAILTKDGNKSIIVSFDGTELKEDEWPASTPDEKKEHGPVQESSGTTP